VFAKLLANRLRTVTGLVISKEQLAFVHGCQIPDGILMGNELADEAHNLKN